MSGLAELQSAATRALDAAKTADRAARDAGRTLNERAAARDLAAAVLVGAEDAFDADPSLANGAAVIDAANALRLAELLVARARDRIGPLAAASAGAQKAQNEAMFAVRSAESEIPLPKPPPSFDRSFLEKQASMGNETAVRMLGVERLPIINGELSRPLVRELLDRGKQAIDALLGSEP
jgi:hypothetical protein